MNAEMHKIGKRHECTIARATADFSYGRDTPVLTSWRDRNRQGSGCRPGESRDLRDSPQPPVFERNDAVEAASEIEVVGRDQSGEAGAADEIE